MLVRRKTYPYIALAMAGTFAVTGLAAQTLLRPPGQRPAAEVPVDGVPSKVFIGTRETEALLHCGASFDAWQLGLEARKVAYRNQARDAHLDRWARRTHQGTAFQRFTAYYNAGITNESAIVGYLGRLPEWTVPWAESDWVEALRVGLAPAHNLRNDSDMGVNGWIRVLYRDRREARLPDAARKGIASALKFFKYWIDEKRPDDIARDQIFWSENHQMMYGTAELLAGQLFPKDLFGDAQTGDAHRAKAATRLRRLLNERLRYGFSEWNSPVYYEYEILPLLNLVDFSEDREIATRAAMVLDLLFFDLARFTQRGSFGVTAGRVYGDQKATGWRQSVGDTIEILFGTRGRFGAFESPAAHALASTTKYCVPSVILAIGQHKPERFVDRSRVSVNFDELLPHVGYTSEEDALFWWSKGAYFTKQMNDTSNRIIKKYRIEHKFEDDLLWVKDESTPFGKGNDLLSVFFEGMALTRANLYTYRDDGAMLSSVQGWRPGQVGPQSSAWQVTLNNDVHVFGSYPVNRDSEDGPNHWTGTGVNPFVVQRDSAAIVIYAPDPVSAQGLIFEHKTHLWFPFGAPRLEGKFAAASGGHFDEIRRVSTHKSNGLEDSVWFFGRKKLSKQINAEEGYVGIYSAQPCRTVRSGTWGGKEITCTGLRNAFVIQVGSKKTYGSFDNFVNACSNARIFVGAGIRSKIGLIDLEVSNPLGSLVVNFDSPDPVLAATPGGHRLQADYRRREARFANNVFDIQNFPRFENPYTQTRWGAQHYRIALGGNELVHDQVKGTRDGTGMDIRPYEGRFPTATYTAEVLYGVRPDGVLAWYFDRVASDIFTAEDRAGMIQGAVTRAKTQREVELPTAPPPPPPQAAPAAGSGGVLSARTLRRERAALGGGQARPPIADRPISTAGPAASSKTVEAPWVRTPLEPRKFLHEWAAVKEVGTGWGFADLVSGGGNILYGITAAGDVKWYQHVGSMDGTLTWNGAVDVATGWAGFRDVFGGGQGVLYGIKDDGTLVWARHLDHADATRAPQQRWSDRAIVGTGWNMFTRVFSMGEGVVYGIQPNGELWWYRHVGYLTGTQEWEGPVTVGSGWAHFKEVFSPGRGRIFAVTQDGTLLCYQHNGYRGGTMEWQGPQAIGTGWGDFNYIIPSMWFYDPNAIRLH